MARIVLDQKQYKRLNTQKQEVSRTIQKSFSDDVVIFDYEPMKKYFVYVPKVYGDDGEFGKVRAFLHSVKNGAITQMVRCINGLEDETLGLDGECPPFCPSRLLSKRTGTTRLNMTCLNL